MKTNRLSPRGSDERGLAGLEFVITVVILGAIFAMALKGAVLISAMRAFVLGQQISTYQAAVQQYEVDYRALPGDDPAAAARWGRTPALFNTTVGVVSMAGDGKINGLLTDPANASGEQYLAWSDLRSAGILPGDPGLVGQSAQPETHDGGVYGFSEDNLGLEQVLCLTKVEGKAAEFLDKRLDDGNPATGKVRGTSKWDPVGAHNHFTVPDSGPYDAGKTYIICLSYLP